MQSIGMDFSFELAKAWPYFAPNMYLSPAMLPDYPQSSAGMDQNSMQVQQLHLVQNPHAQAGFTGYGPAFVASPPFMQTEYPMQYGMQYGVHYGLQPAEKPAPAPSQEHVPASRDSDGPPAKAARTKKTGEKNGTSTYASRHQAAESRRRQRINDRFTFYPFYVSCLLGQSCAPAVGGHVSWCCLRGPYAPVHVERRYLPGEIFCKKDTHITCPPRLPNHISRRQVGSGLVLGDQREAQSEGKECKRESKRV
jgi:hypothetical protein